MKSLGLNLLAIILLLASGSVSGANDESEEKAVRSALDNYTKACERCDFELLSSVFSHDRDIVLINAASPRWLVGWTTVAEVYKGLFSVSGDVKMQHTNVSVKLLASGSAAFLTCKQTVKGTAQGKAFAYEDVRMTCVLEKQQGHWRIVHGHWSLPSTTDAQAGDERNPPASDLREGANG
jgi:ketosteroid isomerase-like protein